MLVTWADFEGRKRTGHWTQDLLGTNTLSFDVGEFEDGYIASHAGKSLGSGLSDNDDCMLHIALGVLIEQFQDRRKQERMGNDSGGAMRVQHRG